MVLKSVKWQRPVGSEPGSGNSQKKVGDSVASTWVGQAGWSTLKRSRFELRSGEKGAAMGRLGDRLSGSRIVLGGA